MKQTADIYILGGSQTDFARNWQREGLELFDMFSESLREAVANAEIDPQQIEVGHVGNFVGELFAGQGLIGGFFGHVFPELAALPTSRHEAARSAGTAPPRPGWPSSCWPRAWPPRAASGTRPVFGGAIVMWAY